MTMLTLDEAALLIPGATVVGDGAQSFARVSTDSRTAGPGDLFVALKGERFDAHDFVGDLGARGVAAVMVSRADAQTPHPYLLVADTRIALGVLARGWRRRFDLPLVAVTGSNGKTTVKEMIAAIFAAAVGEEQRLATRGNLNNDIGVPLTLLRLTSVHQLAVVELGMNHPDETAYIADLAEPTVALVNNAQREHQEFMRTVEAVALEHASVIHALGADGTAVFPADDKYTPIWRVAAHTRRVIDFALLDDAAEGVGADAVTSSQRTHEAAVTGKPGSGNDAHGDHNNHGHQDDNVLSISTPLGGFVVRLRIQGRHNLRNALAATAAAIASNVPLEAIRLGLEAFEPVKGRLQVKVAGLAPFAGAKVIDDSYNANPDSMRAAIDVLARAAAPRVLIVGDMGEVGDQEAPAHREIGAYAASQGIDHFYAMGSASKGACTAFGATARHFATPAEMMDALVSSGLGEEATFLIKGSRFMAMERIVDALVAAKAGNEQVSAGTKADVPGGLGNTSQH